MPDTAFFSLAGPLDALPAAGQMRAANLTSFHDLVRRLGGDSRSILERFDIDAAALGDSDYLVNCTALGNVLEYCSSRFDRSLFGLDLAELQTPDVFGLATAISRAASTLGEALDCFIKYMPVVHSPVSDLEIVKGRDVCELRFAGTSTVQGFDGCQIMYEAGLLIAKLLRELCGSGFQPLYVSLARIGQDGNIAEIERRFGCPCRKSADINAIAFPARMLNQPIRSASRQLYTLLDGYLDRVHTATRASLTERLEDCIRSSLASGKCSTEWCARKLGMSPRALRVRLGQMNLRFSDVVVRERMKVSADYLDRKDLTLDEVAFALGYSEQSSFGRAFKRWTGKTPQEHRELGQGRLP